MTSSLITDGVDFVEYLRELLGSTPWSKFEETRRGEITIAGVLFKMRLGLHMNRHFRAIIALGHFVRMEKAETVFADLKKLTPEAPDTCMYYIPAGCKGVLCWHPNGWTRERDEHSEPEKDYTILDASHFFNNLGRSKWPR